jgi:hypothetical protein
MPNLAQECAPQARRGKAITSIFGIREEYMNKKSADLATTLIKFGKTDKPGVRPAICDSLGLLAFVFSNANITSTLVKAFGFKLQRLVMQNPCGKVG